MNKTSTKICSHSLTSIKLYEQQLPENNSTCAFTFAPWQTVLITSAGSNAVFGCQQESAFVVNQIHFLVKPFLPFVDDNSSTTGNSL